MIRKFVLVTVAVFGMLFTQAQLVSDDELAMIRTELKKEKKDLVNEYMALDEAGAAKFWPLYDEYNEKRRSLSQERIQVIKDYGSQFSNMTDDQAKGLVNRIFKNDKAQTKLDEKYFKKISKAVGPLKAAQYLQMETYFRTIIRAEVQDAIPFIGEIERKKG